VCKGCAVFGAPGAPGAPGTHEVRGARGARCLVRLVRLVRAKCVVRLKTMIAHSAIIVAIVRNFLF